MDGLNKLMDELNQNQKDKALIEKAKDKFAYKPAIKSLRNLYLTAKYSRFILGGFSVLTGVMFFIYLFPGNVILSIIVASLLFGVLEIAKNLLADLSFTKYYSSEEVSFYFLGTAFTLVLSVFCSVHGVKDMYKGLDDSIQTLDDMYSFKVDSIQDSFDLRIANIKKEETKFKESVTYRGKINIHNKATKNKIEYFSKVLSNLDNNKVITIDELKNSHYQEIANQNRNNIFNQNAWMIISLTVELLIITCLWFVNFYYYTIAKESNVISTGYRLNNSSIEEFARFFRISNDSSVIPISKKEDAPKIGFTPGKNNNNDTTPPFTAKGPSPVLPPNTTSQHSSLSDDEEADLINEYEEKIAQKEDEIKEKTIQPRPCKMCSKIISNPKSDDTTYHHECRVYKTRIYKYLATARSSNKRGDADNVLEKLTWCNKLIADQRGVEIKPNLFTEFINKNDELRKFAK